MKKDFGRLQRDHSTHQTQQSRRGWLDAFLAVRPCVRQRTQ